MDNVRPAVDIAFPTEQEVTEFHLNPNVVYPPGTTDIRRLSLTAIGTGMAGG